MDMMFEMFDISQENVILNLFLEDLNHLTIGCIVNNALPYHLYAVIKFIFQ